LLTGVGAEAEVWDLATGRPLTRPMKHPGPVVQVAFSPDGQMLATVCDDGRRKPGEGRDPNSRVVTRHAEVRLWKAATGTPIGAALRCPTHPFSVRTTFSPDSRTLVVRDRRLEHRLHDLFTLAPLGPSFELPGDMVPWGTWGASSPDGKRALMAQGGSW